MGGGIWRQCAKRRNLPLVCFPACCVQGLRPPKRRRQDRGTSAKPIHSSAVLSLSKSRWSTGRGRGKFYLNGCSPSHRAQRWKGGCEDLAMPLADKVREKHGRRRTADLTRSNAELMVSAHWANGSEATWIAKRTYQNLNLTQERDL